MLSQVCHGNVAVVGNGSLTPEDREQINNSNFDCIVRFNDRKNLIDGEKTTVHAVRDLPSDSTFLSQLIFGKQRRVPGLVPGEHVFVQPITARPDSIRDKFAGTTMLPPILVQEKGGSVESEQYFPDCVKCQNGEYDCNTSASTSGPSSGTVLINILDAQPTTTSIHVFGMNWNGGHNHFDFKQPELISDCCVKCNIHPTASSNYI
tara:strand:- start:950 stop:1567 length:618 start_codon:yes stop_codon:yes gene_type:complete